MTIELRVVLDVVDEAAMTDLPVGGRKPPLIREDKYVVRGGTFEQVKAALKGAGFDVTECPGA